MLSKYRRIALALLIVVSAIALVACNNDEEEAIFTPPPTTIPAPTRVVPPANTVAPADTPPAPTDVSEPTAAPVPTEAPAPTTAPEPTTAPAPTAKPAPTSTPVPTAQPPSRPVFEPVNFTASALTIAVDGDTSDWAGVAPQTVTLQQPGPIPGHEWGEIDPIDISFRVTADSDNVYMLIEVPGEFLYNADDHKKSAAIAVMLKIESGAGPAMGSDETDLETALGMVDIWHWELDCAPGALSGGGAIQAGGVTGGNDPPCNFDDEYSTNPEEREDDGSTTAENSLLGVWDHTARASGLGTDGTWVFEMSRPLLTGDEHDAQLVLGQTHSLALAYWAADETEKGWTDAGHIQSASKHGWIEVTLPTAAEAAAASTSQVSFTASAATIAVDGDTSDWQDIAGAQVRLQQIGPIPGLDMAELAPVDVTLRVATDSDNIYILLEVPDDYDYNPENHKLSAANAVMFLIDPAAAPHMGTTQEDQDTSLGKVDIWHWELDCAPGALSGGGAIQAGGVTGGNDPPCNFDDEYSTTPTEREDDGSTAAENSLIGVWDHTARASGNGSAGTWIFEMSRPLDTGDPDDAIFVPGATVKIALAYWDADETDKGWTDAAHLQSSDAGWIEVTLPTAAEAAAASTSQVSFTASAATIAVDGDTSDWQDIAGAQVRLQQIGPIPGLEMAELAPVDVTLRVATDSDNIYVLLEVPDDYDYNPENHKLSAANAVMFLIDPDAAPHMGTTQEDQDTSLGKVDIWHWELDCAPGALSGGGAIQAGGVVGGNDPPCNFDDEYSTTPTEREDDGSTAAENSLIGVWDHTARASGNGSAGTWIFEMSRPLDTGDPDDAIFVPGATVKIALAYWDADETEKGWTDAAHLQSSDAGWILVTLP